MSEVSVNQLVSNDLYGENRHKGSIDKQSIKRTWEESLRIRTEVEPYGDLGYDGADQSESTTAGMHAREEGDMISGGFEPEYAVFTSSDSQTVFGPAIRHSGFDYESPTIRAGGSGAPTAASPSNVKGKLQRSPKVANPTKDLRALSQPYKEINIQVVERDGVLSVLIRDFGRKHLGKIESYLSEVRGQIDEHGLVLERIMINGVEINIREALSGQLERL